jgi:UDP-N-acetyl-D-mannosaminuronate dehydrogenase
MHCDLLVIGLGYVGLPLAREATAAGMTVVGYDVNQAIVDRLNRGGSHVDDILADDVAAMLTAGFRATSDESAACDLDRVARDAPLILDTRGRIVSQRAEVL